MKAKGIPRVARLSSLLFYGHHGRLGDFSSRRDGKAVIRTTRAPVDAADSMFSRVKLKGERGRERERERDSGQRTHSRPRPRGQHLPTTLQQQPFVLPPRGIQPPWSPRDLLQPGLADPEDMIAAHRKTLEASPDMQ
ncbi:uncharacterized protein LOC112589522 [Harpegnathos saltator]|uniref:uncharacterized protein LOC112589522 n=1 Tax=Harpegnathos saltator TaxID=610380 RepID=UPI000DBED57E|nr:uncharacterized protein LOC112589522 [Harpegnathos saltator]